MRNRTENQIEITLLRHGKTGANLEHRYLGRTDEELCEEGIQELRTLKSEGNYPSPIQTDVVAASPMKRCRQTAELLYPGRKILLVEEFREMDFGAFEGKNYKELQGDVRYQAWIDSNGTLPFPEGESRESFQERCQAGFLKMLEQIDKIGIDQQKEQEIIAISAVVHGGTIMALLSSYGEGDYFDYQCENGRGYQCEVCYRLDSGGKVLPESIVFTKIRRL